MNTELINDIEQLYDQKIELNKDKIEFLLTSFIDGLNKGTCRAAEPDGNNNWKVNQWVKKGILLIFRYSSISEIIYGDIKFFDKNMLPLKEIQKEDGIRFVPGGSAVRNGCYLASGVICMPPMYVNIGAYVDSGTMIDSHALIGTCAQIGKNVHVSAAAQVGGVLEPAGAKPVVIEDNVMIGGNCGIYEGVLIRKRAVLASGVVLNASSKVYDLVNEKIITSTVDKPLEIPEGAVVVSGSRQINSEFSKSHGLSIYSPLIVKYRDDKTDSKTALNFELR